MTRGSEIAAGPRRRSGAPLLVAALAVWSLACAAGESGEPGQAEGAASVVPQESGGGDSTAAPSGDLVPIRVAGQRILVEIAQTDAERQRGLMHRESLPADQGMLFVYPEERPLGFWMKNTLIPLDIAYLDRAGRIVDIQQMEPLDETTYYSQRPAMYALEMNRGWFEAHGVQVGDRVEF